MPKSECAKYVNFFCYICGEYNKDKNMKEIKSNPKLQQLYAAYFFPCKIGDQEDYKTWAPKRFCTSCYSSLSMWHCGKLKKMRFGIPMMWREQKDHHEDCYFCKIGKLANSKRSSLKNIQYPNDVSSVTRPIPHSELVPVPQPPINLSSFCTSQSDEDCVPVSFEKYN